MMRHRGPPGMQDSEEADLCAQMLGVGGDAAQRLRGGSEQDVVNRSLVLERDDSDQLRHCEHHVEVGHLEQFRLAVRQPLGAGKALTLRAASIAAAVVRYALMAAVAAALDMAAEGCSAAAFDRPHGAPPRRRQRRAVLVTKSLAEVAEHVRHFQPIVGHGTRASGRYEIRGGWRDSWQ